MLCVATTHTEAGTKILGTSNLDE